MPLNPENRKRYPKDWTQISDRIRFDRARSRCELCGIPHGSRRADNGSRVILTVHHLDARPENCDEKNLIALCQRCHLRADAELHRANAHATRLSKQVSEKQARFPWLTGPPRPKEVQTPCLYNPGRNTRPNRAERPLKAKKKNRALRIGKARKKR